MSVFSLPVPDIAESMEIPIVHAIINGMTEQKFLPPISRKVIKDIVKVAKTPGSDTNPHTKHAYMKDDTYAEVGVEREYFKQGGSFLRSDYIQTNPIFRDKTRGIYIRPIYEDVKYTLTIEIISPSVSLLQEWLRHIRTQRRGGYEHMNHSLNYSYGLHQKTWTFLEDMYKLSENKYGNDRTFSEYLKHHSDNQIVPVTSGVGHQLVKMEQQVRVYGNLGSPFNPKIQEVGDGVYSVVMTYNYTMKVPHSLMYSYPLVVHQQVIDCKYITYPEKKNYPLYTQNALTRGFTTTQVSPDVFHTLRIPDFDRVPITYFPIKHYPVITMLVTLPDDQDKPVFNLNELCDATLDQDTLDMMSEILYQDMTSFYKSPYIITLHRDNILMDENFLSVDKDLNVRTKNITNYKNVYRISLCVLTDIGQLRGDVINKLKHYAKPVVTLTTLINQLSHFAGQGGVNKIIIPSDITMPMYLNTIIPLITDVIPDEYDPRGKLIKKGCKITRRNLSGWKSHNLVSMKTVMTTSTHATTDSITNVRKGLHNVNRTEQPRGSTMQYTNRTASSSKHQPDSAQANRSD